MRSVVFLLLAGFVLLFVAESRGQEIRAEVTVNMERLEFETRTNVSTMKRDIEGYINNQRFTQGDWEGDAIPVRMTIYLSGGSGNRYGAKLFIIATRPIDGPGERQSVNVKLYDDKWSFEYARGANLTFNLLRFDAFTSLIDYYMLLVIGFELDTWEELSGKNAFNDARRVVELGASYNGEGFSTYSNPGEFTRYNLTSELTNMRYEEFRRLLFAYYVDGLDLMASDRSQALKNLKDIIYELALFKKDKLVESSVLMQLFFDSKAQEIATIFNGHEDEDVFVNLKYVDPSNSTLYDDAKDGKLGGR